jgi:hypothetical protein
MYSVSVTLLPKHKGFLMTDSLDLGPETGINSRLAVLRELDIDDVPHSAGKSLVPGVFFVPDTESQTSLTLESRNGMILRANYEIQGTARWLGLHIDMADCSFDGKTLFGVAMRSQAPRVTTFNLCLRNGREGGFDDHFFRKTGLTFPESSLHLDALTLSETPGLWGHAPWRELILFLKPESGSIDLLDLKVFTL